MADSTPKQGRPKGKAAAKRKSAAVKPSAKRAAKAAARKQVETAPAAPPAATEEQLAAVPLAESDADLDALVGAYRENNKLPEDAPVPLDLIAAIAARQAELRVGAADGEQAAALEARNTETPEDVTGDPTEQANLDNVAAQQLAEDAVVAPAILQDPLVSPEDRAEQLEGLTDAERNAAVNATSRGGVPVRIKPDGEPIVVNPEDEGERATGRVVLGEHLYFEQRDGEDMPDLHRTAPLGTVLDLPLAEYERGVSIGALQPADAPLVDDVADPLSLSDDALAAWVQGHTVQEVVSHAGTIDGAQRLLNAENAGDDDPRVGVVQGINAALGAHAAALEQQE